MPHSQYSTLNGQTVVGTLLGAISGIYSSLTSALTSDTAHAMLMAAICAAIGFVTTELLKRLRDKFFKKSK